MKLLKTTLIASALAFSANALAAPGDMQINVGAGYAVSPPNAVGDGTTGSFNEFGFSQLLATSIYDASNGSVFGSFFDSNINSELTFNGVPASGTALDGSTPVSLVLPNTPPAVGQADLDALSPLVPPLATDSEGFLLSWDLQVEYNFQGILDATGPDYNSGTFDVFFNDFGNDANDRLVLSGLLTGSNLQAANLLLFFDVSFAEAGWLFVEDNGGNLIDASTTNVKLTLDTNVNPPIPTTDQLLAVVDGDGNTNFIRQTTLDGSIRARIAVPEPATIALLGMGLLGFGVARRRRS